MAIVIGDTLDPRPGRVRYQTWIDLPARDQWTPAELSIQFLERIPANTELVLLERCGHFPVEEPGLTQLVETMRSVRAQAAAGAR